MQQVCSTVMMSREEYDELIQNSGVQKEKAYNALMDSNQELRQRISKLEENLQNRTSQLAQVTLKMRELEAKLREKKCLT